MGLIIGEIPLHVGGSSTINRWLYSASSRPICRVGRLIFWWASRLIFTNIFFIFLFLEPQVTYYIMTLTSLHYSTNPKAHNRCLNYNGKQTHCIIKIIFFLHINIFFFFVLTSTMITSSHGIIKIMKTNTIYIFNTP